MKAGARDRDGASFTGKERWMVGRFDPARSGGLRCGQSQKSSMPCGVAVSSSGKTLKMRIAQKKGAQADQSAPISQTYPMWRSRAFVIWSFGTAPTICSTT